MMRVLASHRSCYVPFSFFEVQVGSRREGEAKGRSVGGVTSDEPHGVGDGPRSGTKTFTVPSGQ